MKQWRKYYSTILSKLIVSLAVKLLCHANVHCALKISMLIGLTHLRQSLRYLNEQAFLLENFFENEKHKMICRDCAYLLLKSNVPCFLNFWDRNIEYLLIFYEHFT